MTNESILNCEDLSKSYHDGALHVDVLRKVNLSVSPGEQVAIVGTSGSGKTTLLHLLGGLDKPSAGSVKVQGHDLSKLNERARCRLRNQTMGYIYQFHHLLPEFTALENVSMPLLISGTAASIAKQKAREILAQVGLSHREQHKLAQLSGGERQRTAIARALINQPLCVLADEPTGNLDGKTAEQVYATMLELNRKRQTSIILVTHDMSLANRMDKIYRLDDGQLRLSTHAQG